MKLYRHTNIKVNLTNLAFYSKICFQKARLVKNFSKTPNKRFWAIFGNFPQKNRSPNQQTIQLDLFRQDLKLKTGSETFLAIQRVIFSKKRPRCCLFNKIKRKCGSQKDFDTAVETLN